MISDFIVNIVRHITHNFISTHITSAQPSSILNNVAGQVSSDNQFFFLLSVRFFHSMKSILQFCTVSFSIFWLKRRENKNIRNMEKYELFENYEIYEEYQKINIFSPNKAK